MERLKTVILVVVVSLLVNASMAVGAGWIGSGDIKDGAVHANDIGKMAVTKTKIKTGAVNKYKIASGAVNQYKIRDGAVTPAKLSESYASTSHNHDSRYYTLSEVNGQIDALETYSDDMDDILYDYVVAIDDILFGYINSLHGLSLSKRQTLKAEMETLRKELLNSRDKLNQ